MPDFKHSRIMGGSTAARVIACPGSVRLSASAPPESESEYAKRGTALHMAIAHCLETSSLPQKIKGQTFHGVEITDELIHDKLNPALLAVVKLQEEAGGPVEVLIEKTVGFCPGETDHIATADVYGTVDLMLRHPGSPVLYVIDYKFGDGIPVSAHENDQLLFYAGCAAYTKGDAEVEAMLKGVTNYVGVIIQPRNEEEDYSTFDFSQDYLEEWLDKMDLAIQTAAMDNAPLQTGDHCRWCPAKTVCPAQIKGLTDLAEMKEYADQVAVTPAVMVEKQDLGHWLDVAQQAEATIAAIRREAVCYLELDGEIPGWHLKPKRAMRRWSNVAKAEQHLTGILGDEAYRKQLLSPAQVEKTLGKAEYAKIAEPLVTAISSGSTLTREGDGRKMRVVPPQKGLAGALPKPEKEPLAVGTDVLDVIHAAVDDTFNYLTQEKNNG